MHEYYILSDGSPAGPFTESKVRDFIAAGKLKPHHRVRIDSGQWLTVSELNLPPPPKAVAFFPAPPPTPPIAPEATSTSTAQYKNFRGLIVIIFLAGILAVIAGTCAFCLGAAWLFSGPGDSPYLVPFFYAGALLLIGFLLVAMSEAAEVFLDIESHLRILAARPTSSVDD